MTLMLLILKAFLNFLSEFSHLLESSTCLRLKKMKKLVDGIKRERRLFFSDAEARDEEKLPQVIGHQDSFRLFF